MTNKNQRGFTFVELLIAIGLIGIFVPVIVKSLSFSLFASHQGEQFTQGYAHAQEGMEAVYSMKSDSGWEWTSSSPTNTSPGEYYQPMFTGGTWQLGSILNITPPAVTKDPYTRSIEILEVQRCPAYDPFAICDSGGAVDDLSRKIIVRVTWPEDGDIGQVQLESYVTAH